MMPGRIEWRGISLMDAQDQGLPKRADAVPAAERRSDTDRRMPGARRQADRRAAAPTPDTPAQLSFLEPASEAKASEAKASATPAIARKFYFRSFDDRRLGIDRRAAPDADDERLTTDEVASLLRQKE
jgi:hypothetical protein